MEPQHVVLLIIALSAVAFVFGRRSRNSEIEFVTRETERRSERDSEACTQLTVASQRMSALSATCSEAEKRIQSLNSELELAKRETEEKSKQYSEACDRLRLASQQISELSATCFEAEKRIQSLQLFVDETLKDWRKQSVLLPSLREWATRLQLEYDRRIEYELRNWRPPATKAAELVKEAHSKTRKYREEVERLRPQLSLYESLAPWLVEFSGLTVDEILEGLKEEAEFKESYKTGNDPVAVFVSRIEWDQLSQPERNQLALERYWQGSRRRSAWTAGIQYERFIGYKYESNGYRVTYHGARFGVDDLGIDLVCANSSETLVIQCKRLSVSKGLPVRENIIAQIYGAARFYSMENRCDAIPVLYTTYECSETARLFARHLGVRLYERYAFEPYPCIKCNISHLSGEKIYHLPFDQQYDSTVVDDQSAEFYAMTVAEAESKGFRRAFRWMGGN